MKEDGCLKRKGDLLVNRQLAITLERISNDPDSFYTGNMADDIVKDISSQQGIITKKDLRSYSVEVKKAINASIGDHKLFTSGLPSSGILLTFILNVLKGRFWSFGYLQSWAKFFGHSAVRFCLIILILIRSIKI